MPTAFLVVGLTAIVGLCIWLVLRSVQRPANYPPGPAFLPWLGNSVQLRRSARRVGAQHLVFDEWSERYGSKVLGLKLGPEYVVVVLGYPLVHEVHVRDVFEGRPDNFFLRLRTMGTRMGITCTDSHLWAEHRHFAMRELRNVGYGRTQMERHIEKETYSLLQHIETEMNEKAAGVWPGSFLALSVINVLWSLTAGQRFERTDSRLVQLLDLLNRRSRVFDLSGGWLAQYPWTRFIAPNKTGYNLVCQLNRQLHGFFMDSIEEHKRAMREAEEAERSVGDGGLENDLIYAYLREMQSRHEDDQAGSASTATFNETQLIMTILDLFIAGSQTTSNTIDLALLTLAHRRDLQARLYEELANKRRRPADSAEGRFVHLSAHAAYPHMDAFIMEVQRYYHITPITGPRRTLWRTQLGGYDIPQNTTILIGLRSVLYDRAHWTDPEEFRPQRFLAKAQQAHADAGGASDAGDVTVRDDYFIPFGQGRRRCLGDALARACIFSFLVHIVRTFDIQLVAGNEKVAAAAAPPVLPLAKELLLPGITMSPRPYQVRFLKRPQQM